MARDHRLIESLDEKEWDMRECSTWEADRRDELMLHQMFCMVKDSCAGPGKLSSSHSD